MLNAAPRIQTLVSGGRGYTEWGQKGGEGVRSGEREKGAGESQAESGYRGSGSFEVLIYGMLVGRKWG